MTVIKFEFSIEKSTIFKQLSNGLSWPFISNLSLIIYNYCHYILWSWGNENSWMANFLIKKLPYIRSISVHTIE